jgi:penicillin-binding protein 1A
MVAVAWIGFDQPKTLGNGETGAVAALPIWINFMGKVLKGIPERPLQQPDGILVVRIDPETGFRQADDHGGIPEYFYSEFPPGRSEDVLAPGTTRTPGEVRNQLF